MDSSYDLSDIQRFFHGSNVLITGGTGFLGTILLEKLLRSCSSIKKIYILMREKKGKTPQERIKAMFDDVIFDRMRKVCPHYASKVTAVIGDCLKSNLGLSETDEGIILNEVNTIFHSAATVRFDAHLKDAVAINIKATHDLLRIARRMKQLKAFVHVSTAYSHCAEREIIEEKFYDTPLSAEGLMKITDILSSEILERITPQIIKPWPNTYAFTKAIAEDTIRAKGSGLPITIVRPAIVIATSKEPIAGWINNFYGPTGIVAGAGLGLLRSVHANGECTADLIPCDNVVNAIIAAAWYTGTTWNKKDHQEELNIPIYNYVSSNTKPLKWKEFMAYNERAEPEIPSVLAVWIYCLTINKYKFIHNIYCIFLHLLPALIVDTFARVIGKEPKLWKAYQKIHRFSEVIAYFSTNQWKFIDSNVKVLQTKLSVKDKEIFDFDLTKLDWKEYFYYHMRGLRVYLVHDSLDTIPKGMEKRKKLMIAHYTLVTIFWCLLLYVTFLISRWTFK